MLKIDIDLAKGLIKEQFPQWSALPLNPVEEDGNDNRTFRLGEEMTIRLPRAECYVAQVDKENQWLPYLASKLSIPMTIPLAQGMPSAGYPWPWSVMKWLKGESLNRARVRDLNSLAQELASFLKDLQAIAALDGPFAGEHNFYRGGSLAVYDRETRLTVEKLKDTFDKILVLKVWEDALKTKWTQKAVWVHGDVAEGNIIINQAGDLCGIIDFGMLGLGDPACDLVLAWTFFNQESRDVFKKSLDLDENTWSRARGWALWKALISYEKYKENNLEKAQEEKRRINSIIEEFLSSLCD